MSRQTTIHTYMKTHTDNLEQSSGPGTLLELGEAGVPEENPHRHWDGTQRSQIGTRELKATGPTTAPS